MCKLNDLFVPQLLPFRTLEFASLHQRATTAKPVYRDTFLLPKDTDISGAYLWKRIDLSEISEKHPDNDF
jgi:hypothetical protein